MKPVQSNSSMREDAGVALVLALVFIVLLAVIVTEFTYETQVDATLIGRANSQTDAYLAARSAVAVTMSVLAADLIIGEDEANQENTGVYDGLDEPWAKQTPVVEFNEAMVAIRIFDEFGKINLNALIYEDSAGQEEEYEPLVEALSILFEDRLPGESPVDAILDWLDADDTARPEGYESDYYEKLDPPIACKNGPMDSLEELLLIPGITAEVYFAEFEEKLDPPLQALPEILTVHGHAEGRVNINTAPQDVLDAIFQVTGASGAASTDQVIQRREEVGSYTSREELATEGLIPMPRRRDGDANGEQDQGNEGEQVRLPDMFDVRSNVFRIVGDSQTGGVAVRVEAFVWRDTPQDDEAGQQASSGAAQIFRVIEWRVET